MRDTLRLRINNRWHSLGGREVFVTLSEYLRQSCGLAGTKVVCAEGDCGACTVLVGRIVNGRLTYRSVDSCIQFMHQLDATHIVTVEGLSPPDQLHQMQQRMVDCHGSQCGYCTPGFVMALAAWASPDAVPAACSPKRVLTGNLCRCTGYLPILEAAAAMEYRAEDKAHYALGEREATELGELTKDVVQLSHAERIVLIPAALADAVAFKKANPDTVIVAGATELGVWRNKRGFEPRALLNLGRIEELNRIDDRDDAISFGANVTWTEIERAIGKRTPEFTAIIERFGSPQIRNVATLAGNIANGSPISDSLGLLSVIDAKLEIAGPKGVRQRSINGFYQGYKKKDLAADELITRVTLPWPADGDRLRLYKVSRRFDLDIATFGAAIRIREEGGTITQAAIAMSGVAPVVMRMTATEDYLVGGPFTEATFREAGRKARAEIQPLTDVRGSADYRLQLAENIFLKFWFQECEAAVLA